MKTINVNSISRKYEQLHKQYEKESMKDERFFAINNAMIFSYFSVINDIEYVGNNMQAVYKKIEEKYGMSLFFYNVKKTNKYKQILKESIDVFYNMFIEERQNTKQLETLLGNVLEKHINQKDTGSYYTPADTTEYISWNTLLIALLNKCSAELQDKVRKLLDIKENSQLLNCAVTRDNIQNKILEFLNAAEKQEMIDRLYMLRIIDPTCGSGAFILMAFECMENLLLLIGEKNIIYNKLLDCLYGVDISKEAIHLTKLRLMMRIAHKDCNIFDFNVMYNKNFIVADALKGSDYVIQEKGFDWRSFYIKFDCIIGNPPYVEMRKYVSEKFTTEKCGNLYAYTIERACNIANEGSLISFVVPLPFVATPRMGAAKTYLEEKSSNIYYGTFADRPGCIFTGVHQRLTIFFAEIGEHKDFKRYSSAYSYWYKEERKLLFKDIRFIQNTYEGILPKVGNDTEMRLYEKLITGKNNIGELLCEESDYPVYLSTRIGFWTKAFLENVFSSKEYKAYFATTESNRYLLTAILNSSTFYFLWVVMSDCWHITNKNIMEITFNYENVDQIDLNELKSKCEVLMRDLEKNKKYIGTKQTEYEYKHKYSKAIIDEIDDLISPIFGFDNDEIEYIKRFTEKYRVNTMEAE